MTIFLVCVRKFEKADGCSYDGDLKIVLLKLRHVQVGSTAVRRDHHIKDSYVKEEREQ